jgi:pilus assembly protein CpaF
MHGLADLMPKPVATEELEKNGYTPPPEFRAVREAAQSFLVNEVKSFSEVDEPHEIRTLIEPVFNTALTDANLVVSRSEREQMLTLLIDEIMGFGPIQPLLDNDDISEVMVNGPKQVYIELNGKLRLSDVEFIDDDHVQQVIERIVAPLGRRIDEASPMVDARLPDGSRVNAIIPPLSLVGPCFRDRTACRPARLSCSRDSVIDRVPGYSTATPALSRSARSGARRWS